MSKTRVLQGLGNYTLVAGKSTTIAIAVNGLAGRNADTLAAFIDITGPGGTYRRVWSYIQAVPIAPSTEAGMTDVLLCTVPGRTGVPDVGLYHFEIDVRAYVFGSVNAFTDHLFSTEAIAYFQPTKDLRVLVVRLYGSASPLSAEKEAILDGLKWLGAVFPVRDGVAELNTDMTAGVRYAYESETLPRDAHLESVFRSYRNAFVGSEICDVAIAFRLPNPGEGWGGNARQEKLGGMPYAVIVSPWDTHGNFAHEVAHLFGAEDSSSPHFDGGRHSKDLGIDPSDLVWGVCMRATTSALEKGDLKDIMWPYGDYNLNMYLNSFDWEFIRQALLSLRSTGPQ